VEDGHTVVVGHMVPDGWTGIGLEAEQRSEPQPRRHRAHGYTAEMAVVAITADRGASKR
jgi:hypothetical protein